MAQDVLEHLTRADGPKALAEWARLLEPGGTLVLRLPNLLGLAFIFTEMTSIEEQKNLVQCLFGTQAYDGDFHQNGYTELLLRHELRTAGFGKAEITSADEWLFDVVATKCEPDGELRAEDCVYMTLDRPSEAVARRWLDNPMPPQPNRRGTRCRRPRRWSATTKRHPRDS